MPYNPPVNGAEFIFYITVKSIATSGAHQVNPTIAAGDFKISKDDGAEANINTLPSVSPASSAWIKVTLSATEMTCDNAKVRWSDQTATKEWADGSIDIVTT